MDVTVLSLPLDVETNKPVSRMESGPVQFIGDWPGVFIRGDHAAHFAFTLREAIKDLHPDGVLQSLPLTIQRNVLVGLVCTLESCIVKGDKL